MSTEDNDAVLGTCMTMCPVEETRMRETNNLLHYFEMAPGTERTKRPRANYNAMVKEYMRPAAGKEDAQPRELRPVDVLLTTVNYLIDKIVPRTDRPWNFVYDYVFDRLRSVRMDMVIQRLSGPVAATILEKIINFHIYSGYRLCSEPMSKFDPKINETHIQECTKRLLVLYEEGRAGSRDNMAEFMSLYLLYNAGRTEALIHGIAQRHILIANSDFRLALEVSTAALLGNYVRMFRLCRRMAPMYQCALSSHLPRLQNEALRTMSAAFHSKALRFDTTALSKLLFYDDARDVEENCRARCLSVNEKGVLFDKSAYTHVEKVPQRRYRIIDETLRTHSIVDLIHGSQEETGVS